MQYEYSVTRHRHRTVRDADIGDEYSLTLTVLVQYRTESCDWRASMRWTARLLTDGLRIYCGKASKRLRKASSAPALFIVVQYGTRTVEGPLLVSLTAITPVITPVSSPSWCHGFHTRTSFVHPSITQQGMIARQGPYRTSTVLV